jgi:hypothetical protein
MKVEESTLGSVGSQSLELVDGKAVLKLKAAAGPASVTMELDIDGKVLLDSLLSKMPSGPVQDVAKALEAAILGV